jgi:hypothetical protein
LKQLPGNLKKLTTIAVASGIVAGLISSGHHWYGAVLYNTPWRVQVSWWIMGIVLLVYSLLYVHYKYAHNLIGKIALWAFFLGAVVFQSGFTLFECVYSHVMKDILYFGGVPESLLLKLYPPPAYHLPDNWFFEVTGWLQLAGFAAAWSALQVVRNHYGLDSKAWKNINNKL